MARRSCGFTVPAPACAVADQKCVGITPSAAVTLLPPLAANLLPALLPSPPPPSSGPTNCRHKPPKLGRLPCYLASQTAQSRGGIPLFPPPPSHFPSPEEAIGLPALASSPGGRATH
ncbi:hypothetical protein E2562_003359 [Oryza meyeriana var. granulata]|uniref:Uncharacterized protein n=1 Tax=Oryza meyeriana var. granulata TaxID=110450 RepID=A0A6G1EFF7_9ORYZ|nr:hypothetical protein E2562_003359 [Oryza meyeriana var. granulata]